MTSSEFPMSEACRSVKPLVTLERPSLRLACQWSPISWQNWTLAQFKRHQLRTFVRCVLNELADVDPKAMRMDPSEILREGDNSWLCDPAIESFPEELHLHWNRIGISNKETETEQMRILWSSIPSILALQQSLQPVLEALILSDRVKFLRESLDANTRIGLIRIFDPAISPRCLAVVAKKRI
ncbi:hypothetical protein Ciccas_013577 [Cichlidogyrus casuarinus]|uniref:Uncharacterized protein n=1 Tax=Cichlidogyrus casuarinus TaxID=1844966 RepID=A0ABD2PM09_9PLAT